MKKTGCGGELAVSGSPTDLTSPGFSGPSGTYENNLNCEWTISNPTGESISITFKFFEVL